MSSELVLISVACLISFLNLLATILLSNAIFKLITGAGSRKLVTDDEPEKGLLDLPAVDNYDPRFRS